jgi:hypothetical protein
VKTSTELEREFMESLHEVTGVSLADWLASLRRKDLNSRNVIAEWLMTQGMNHLQSQLLAGIYLNNGMAVYQRQSAESKQKSRMK